MRSYVVADVFTDVPLEGNQLAVFTDGDGLSDEVMQRTAREMNLSETVFVLPPGDGEDARIRIFTPATELPFAGHPVLGSAFVIGERLGLSTVALGTGAGVVSVALTRAGDRIVFGEMDQPIPTVEPFARVSELLAALGLERAELPVDTYRNGLVHICVMLERREAVAALAPDMAALAVLGALNVSCFSADGVRVKTRMFAPGLGVAEDPATGSAAGPVAVHLALNERIQFGEQIEIEQGVEILRPSTLHARVEGSREQIERVVVGGSAVIVAGGEYRLA
jgi:trans-2,3-dihydro-3-hydroxyanthranilate isomerase